MSPLRQPFVLSLVTALVLLGSAGSVHGAEAATHQITLSNGQTIAATDMAVRGDKLVIRSHISGGVAEVPYPLVLVERVEFKLTASEADLLDSGDPSRLGELKAFWRSREPFLKIPGSDAGSVGLHYARILVAGQDKTMAREALEVVAQIREFDWNKSRRNESSRLRIAALAAAGRIEEAMKEADAMADLGESDDAAVAEARVRANFVQADVAWGQLKQLEADWPKWHLMPEKRGERTALLNRALDHYLFPVVAHADLTSLCAEGLVAAAAIYLHLDRQEEAAVCIEEVLNHFPDPAHVGRAREIQRKLNPQGNSS